MKHIAQPFLITQPQHRRTVIISAESLPQAFLRTINDRPARLLVSYTGARKLRVSIKRLYEAVFPSLAAISEAIASAMWLLFLIFGLNIIAALV